MDSALYILVAALWVVVICALVALVATMRQVGAIHKRIPPVGARMTPAGGKIGDTAPDWVASDLQGREIRTLSGDGRHTLLIFVSPRCSTCAELAPSFDVFARSERDVVRTVVIVEGSFEDASEYARTHRIRRAAVVGSLDAHDRFQVSTTPYGLLLGPDGGIASKGIVNTLEHLESLAHAAGTGLDSAEEQRRLLAASDEEMATT